MDIKQELTDLADEYEREGEHDHVVKVCRDALAEIERLEPIQNDRDMREVLEEVDELWDQVKINPEPAMKPLPVAPLTIEDGRIWAWVLVRFLPGIGLGIVSQASDRRDAELMLGLSGIPCGGRGHLRRVSV